jgi:hypothetical protein
VLIGRRTVAGLITATFLAALGPGHGALSADGKKTLSRTHDPVIVPGAQLTALPTRNTAQLRLHRFEDGREVPVPFQFDQRDELGDVVVGGPAEFELDDNDELVFMAKDAGDRAGADPCPTPCDAALEIQIADPVTGESGWVYLTAQAAPEPRATAAPYVVVDAGGQVAESPYYRVEYAPQRNYFPRLSVGSGAGARSANLLRQSRMHGSPTFSLFVTDLTLDFTEQNSLVEIDGVRSGPVRAVRRARLSVDLGPLFPELPSGVVYTYHYLTSYETPSRVSFPWIMVKTLRDFRFESVLDFRPEGKPTRYFDAAHPGGVSLGDGAGETRTSEDHDWWVHSSDAGTVLHAFVIPARWREWGIIRGGVVRPGRDAGAASGGTASDGEGEEAAGYTLLNMTKLREAGTFDLLMASIVLARPFRAGDEERPMEMLRSPLTTAVRRVR